MPSIPLITRGVVLTQRKGEQDEVRFERGLLPLSAPLSNPPLPRVRNFRAHCNFRVPPVPGVWEAILDTGAPLSLIPRERWHKQFGWREGIHFEVCDFAGLGPFIESQLLSHTFRCRIVRLQVPVEIAGTDLRGPRFTVENMIAQLPETDAPNFTVFGLWGGVFEGRRLVVDRTSGDDIAARFDW